MAEAGSTATAGLGTDQQDALEAEFLGWAYALAARFKNRGVATEDLRQVAAEALIKAARGFDPERGSPFPAYATSTILGMLRRYFRDSTWCVHLPRALQETALAIMVTRETLTQDLGRSPTATDLAAHLGMTIEQVLDGTAAAGGYHGVPFEFAATDGELATGAGVVRDSSWPRTCRCCPGRSRACPNGTGGCWRCGSETK